MRLIDSPPRNMAQLATSLRSGQDRIADVITKFAGSMNFVYVHVVWFGIWMFSVEADPWPKLTLIVSLEAIFLATFVMVSQNRQAALADLRAERDYEADVHSQVWVRHVAEKLGIAVDELNEDVRQVIDGTKQA